MDWLRPLPERRLDSAKRVRARVNSGSLIAVDRNSYSVKSRLIGELVEARVFADHLETTTWRRPPGDLVRRPEAGADAAAARPGAQYRVDYAFSQLI